MRLSESRCDEACNLGTSGYAVPYLFRTPRVQTRRGRGFRLSMVEKLQTRVRSPKITQSAMIRRLHNPQYLFRSFLTTSYAALKSFCRCVTSTSFFRVSYSSSSFSCTCSQVSLHSF